MKTKAKLRFLRISPRKVRLLIDLIRGMKVADAIVQLEHSKKNAAKPVLKLLQSAIANAKHNHGIKEETLKVAEAYVDGGPVLKRWMPRAFGRATMLRKRTSHVTIVLEGEADEKNVEAEKKKRNKSQETNKSKNTKDKKTKEATEKKETKKDIKENKDIEDKKENKKEKK